MPYDKDDFETAVAMTVEHVLNKRGGPPVIAPAVVAVATDVPPASGQGRKGWEIIGALLAVATFLILYAVQPITGLRDDVHDIKTAQTSLLKTVADHEGRLHNVEVQNRDTETIREARSKRLDAVESDTRDNQRDINGLRLDVSQLKTGQQGIQKTLDDSARKLDDLLNAQRH